MSSDLELLDRRAVCSLFGGIHPATLYRGIRVGRFPRPVKVGASSRWLRYEVETCLAAMVNARPAADLHEWTERVSNGECPPPIEVEGRRLIHASELMISRGRLSLQPD